KPGESDEVIESAVLKRSRGFVALAGLADGHERNVIEPGLAAANQHEAERDLRRIVGHIADDFVITPISGSDGAVAHVVEEAGAAIGAIHAEPELGPVADAGDVRTHRRFEADALAAEWLRSERLQQVAKAPLLAGPVLGKKRTLFAALGTVVGHGRGIAG